MGNNFLLTPRFIPLNEVLMSWNVSLKKDGGLIWKEGHCKHNQLRLKCRHTTGGGGQLMRYDWCPYKKTTLWMQVKMEAELRVMHLQAKAKDHQQVTHTTSWETGMVQICLQKEPTLLASWFQASGLQNCERIHFCCFKLPSLWWFVTAALENQYTRP